LVIIIKNKEYNREVIENENIVYLDNICKLKQINDDNNVLILIDLDIDNNGVIMNHHFFLEEVLITINVGTIISNTRNEKVEEICAFHKINYFRL
jgi:hypothetical protein